MQEKITKEFNTYYANGTSKKNWYTFYRRLCLFYNIDRRIQLGLRGVPVESIIEKCRELVETGRPLYHQKHMENKTTEKQETPTSHQSSINISTVQNKNSKIMLNFSVLVDQDTFLEIIQLISDPKQNLQTL